MGLFTSKTLDSLETLLIDQLEDLYDAEQRLTEALPLMAKAAHNPSLKSAFESHLKETQNHLKRLQESFRLLGHEADSKTCQAMKGLIAEGNEVLSAKGEAAIIDAALIAAAQRTEHYEMAGYGTARNFAQRLGRADVARLLQQTLDEEGAADKKLTQIAEQQVNASAASAG